MTASAIAQRARRVRRPWRAAFALVALSLTIATHWPKLRLGTESVPAPDKIVHMLAFGGLLVLVWRTGWIKRLWLTGAIVAVWAALDEVSQGLPVLQRTVSWQDLLASELGVAVAVAFMWALAPVGGTPNRMRLTWHGFVWENVFAVPRGWLSGGLGAAVGGAAALAVIWPALRMLGMERELLAALLVGAAAGALPGAILAASAVHRRRAAELIGMRPCFACGASCREAAFSEHGQGECPACGEYLHQGQWIEPPALDKRKAFRATAGLAIVTTAVTSAVSGLALALAISAWRFAWARTIATDMGLLTDDMQIAMGLAAIGLGCAAGLRVLRRQVAQVHDRQALRCRRCDHDLRGTPLTRGVGVCGECGGHFARFEG